MYLKKVKNKDLAEAIGMSKDHLSLLFTGKIRLKAIDAPYPSKEYNEALKQYIRRAKIGKFVLDTTNQEFLKSFGEVSSRHDELERLVRIGAFYENVISNDLIEGLV